MRQRIFATTSASTVVLILLANLYLLDPTLVKTARQYSAKETTIQIVSWTQRYDSYAGPWFAEGSRQFGDCELPEGVSCTYWHNKSLHSTSDVSLFAALRLPEEGVPNYRRPDQLWLVYSMESPSRMASEVNMTSYGGLFNVSATYSDEADVTVAYGECRKRSIPSARSSSTDNAANKTQLVAWFVSNCGLDHSGRMKYARQLQKYIPVHIYGRCGNYTCSRANETSCNQLLREKYKFYLAFENSLCQEYITEKFWRCFKLNVVPVVLGAANYGKHAPAHSFIDVRDFASPKHLADYLLYLHGNDTAYNEYFQWKDTYTCEETPFWRSACKMCQFAHQKRTQQSVTVSDAVKAKTWDSGTQCQSVQDFRTQCNCWP